jgi:hypothetical protein
MHEGERGCAHTVLVLAQCQPSLTATQRRAIDARLNEWGMATPAERPRPAAMALDELVRRIVIETAVAQAPLIASLRGLQ